MEEEKQPIIVIKKKVGHGGHHGGAWKVAYADFVTAMMAFFMVMWLMNSNEKIKEAVAGYFKDPDGAGKQTGSASAGQGDALNISRDNMGNLKDQLEQAMRKMPDFQQLKDQVAMTVTGEGLRIELLETEQGMFFESGSAKPSASGEVLLSMLSEQLGGLPNSLLIEGHTDSKPFAGDGSYTNWELSSERANSARRLMETHGLRNGQVAQVRGFADRKLRVSEDPLNPSNRRVSVIVKYMDPPAAPAAETGAPPAPKPAGHGKPAH
ncbi:MAG: OmpA family protein [Bryobacterales bacterium]|nr:OmpA family protein [Bryobacterales bacterium]